MNYSKFNGKTIDEVAIFVPEKSYYNHNYFIDNEGNEIFALSDDDNLTNYYYRGIEFAESFVSQGDIIIVYDKFMEVNENDRA